MNKYENDKRYILTLDAGGTNFVFSAMQANREVVAPLKLPSHGDDLDKCFKTMIEGFTRISGQLPEKPHAISFAFPGPADYKKGIIGELVNLPAFKGDVALGPMLEEKFNIPVYINNDGNLFAYGEALAGFLPYINDKLKEAGSSRQFQTLLGVTLGTGFGGGIVSEDKLLIGDNSGAAEVWLLRNKLFHDMCAEDGISIRAVRRFYAMNAGIPFEEAPSPAEIHNIATGKAKGNVQAAGKAFETMAVILGDALGNILTLIDGLVVIGGGIAGAAPLILDTVVREMNGSFQDFNNHSFRRLEPRVYNLEDESDLRKFIEGEQKVIKVPYSEKEIRHDTLQRLGVGVSRLGTSQAIALGAYNYALTRLDNIEPDS